MSSYKQERYLLMTLDPLHIGDGGSRLGRVDNSIVREPGTRLPKIPGTALHGAIRQYAAYRYENLDCAGGGKNHTNECPVCYTFGHIKKSGGSEGQSGKVSVSDGRILLFPVHTLAGPVWVTSPAILCEFDPEMKQEKLGDTVKLPQSLQTHDYLNLGWLMLPKADAVFILPEKIKGVPQKIREQAVLISDKLFGHIVNSNLEVRTSVSINPETGAAEDGKLFTYEAIPRATLLWLDVVEDDFSKHSDKRPAWPVSKTAKENNFPNGETWQRPLDLITSSLKLAELLGIGGMGTRGFGRVRLEAHWEVSK